MEKINQLVVSFNPLASASLRCNTAILLMGGTCQSISVFKYLVKYITKDANLVTDSLSIIQHAQGLMQRYPPHVGVDESENQRYLKTFMQRILNNTEGGCREFADTFTAFVNVGGRGFMSSDTTSYLFAHDMVDELVNLFGGDVVATRDVLDEDKTGSLPMYANKDNILVPVSQFQNYIYRCNESQSEMLTEIISNQLRDASRISESHLESIDSMGFDKMRANLLLANCCSSNWIADLSPREFVSMMYIRDMSEETFEFLSSRDRHQMSHWGVDRSRMSGRISNTCFLFHTDHPLYLSHCMVLKAKQSMIILAGGLPPKYVFPDLNDFDLASKTLKHQLDRFGAYVVANYWPCSLNEPPHVGETRLTYDWSGFSFLMDYLYSKEASFIARGRLFEIENLAFGGVEHPKHGAQLRKLITQYRFSEADDLRIEESNRPFGRRINESGNVDGFSDQVNQTAREMAEAFYAEHGEDRSLEEKSKAEMALERRKDYVRSFESSVGTAFHYLEQNLLNRRNLMITQQQQQSQPLDEHLLQRIVIRTTAVSLMAFKEISRLIRVNPAVVLPATIIPDPLSNTSVEDLSLKNKLMAVFQCVESGVDDHTLSRNDLLTEVLKNKFPNVSLEPEQMDVVKAYFERRTTVNAKPLRLLLLGGPGCGKTFVLSLLSKIVEELVPFLFVAVSGSAASNLPLGKTVCNAMAMNPTSKFSAPTSQMAHQPLKTIASAASKLQFLEETFEARNGVFVLDEVSMVSALYLAHSKRRLEELPKDDS
jgi:hypothetical protein